MSSHEDRSQGAMGLRGRDLIAHLVDVDCGRLESLSWPLGNRITAEAEADRLFRFAHQRSPRTVTAFEVTDYTCALRLRTPVGREKFYGIATADIATRPARDDWIRTD
ncbi:hypothetical protein [Natrinema salifodinae]|uniref:Uncharacterized protein n=1 Tax=Natrinema salifodinae TaxID=1202768 RepID=A0A1I0N0Z0_9EURY|nr:hypothetical protein [Natrinema salifodinae]SEV94417.1 hypothetical protein SAMN05216285_1198 [Natrinema salifodinae]